MHTNTGKDTYIDPTYLFIHFKFITLNRTYRIKQNQITHVTNEVALSKMISHNSLTGIRF